MGALSHVTRPHEAAASPLIRVDGVGKVYRSRGAAVEAIRSVSLDIAAGAFVSLLGPSGCGKSSLLMMLGGLETATSGRIAIGGRPVRAPRRDVSVIFQDATLLPWKTALDNVLFPIRIEGKPVGRHRDRAMGLLATVGLDAFADKRPSQLSGGMRQRLALCRALIADPEVLLMDEPFSALDAITRDDMSIVLAQLWDTRPRTAVFVTHNIREAVFLSDRVVVLGGRPSTVIADVAIPFPRPRARDIGERGAFNRLCAVLRSEIEKGHREAGH
jgi:NitT/TauT family transport system ATP-binding protein